ncbi:MAG: glutamate--tRNA ligase [Pseudomonadota bacterium]|nr:glutamate--tRNA ligase [Pseudomonadota bacterium]
MVRTRFAPSPTGYLHIGGARTALYSWAYARKHGGKCILRIEDTDVERSTTESSQAILEAMHWLGLDYDEGPFYQMQRLDRYREVAEKLIGEATAYLCFASKNELDDMRHAQRARGEKPRYDGRWRPENAGGRTPPGDVKPVIRFRNPDDGDVTWNDLVKGPISISNRELDDLVIIRADGVPTYNFGVVVDDLDMGMTHIIRGDDHVNNTPRQINIFRALGAPLPEFGHVPMILGHDGERLSKRHGAVSVMQYHEHGYLPEALLNYLARLGWAHGDDEIFSMTQFVEWFDLNNISRSPARFDAEKLSWLNQHYLKESSGATLAPLIAPRLRARECDVADDDPKLAAVADLLKPRATTLENLADGAVYFYRAVEVNGALRKEQLKPEILPVLESIADQLQNIAWTREAINNVIKETAAAHKLKLGQIGMPLRVALSGGTQTPPLDATLELIGREEVSARIRKHL